MSLSRRALVFIGLIIVLAITEIWTENYVIGIWKGLALSILLLMVWEKIKLNTEIVIKRDISTQIALAEKTIYYQTVTNANNRQSLFLECQPQYPELLGDQFIQRWDLARGESQTRKYTITPVSLDSTTLGNLYGRVLGKFGLIWWNQNFNDQVSFKVEPAGLPSVRNLTGLSQSGGRKTRYKPGNGFELLTLRDYQYGDSQRNIDWKASARRQKPMIRIFSQEQRLEIIILVDCGRASNIQSGIMNRLHHYVNIASQLADYVIRHDDKVACLAYAGQVIDSIPMSSGILAVKQIRSLLTNLSVVPEESNPLTVALELKRFLKQRSLVIILTEIEQAEAATQLIQAVQILKAKHRILVASINDPEIVALPHQIGEKWLAPYQNLAALEYMRGRELTAKKLQQFGVSVITASAEKLNDEVLNYYQYLHQCREI